MEAEKGGFRRKGASKALFYLLRGKNKPVSLSVRTLFSTINQVREVSERVTRNKGHEGR